MVRQQHSPIPLMLPRFTQDGYGRNPHEERGGKPPFPRFLARDGSGKSPR